MHDTAARCNGVFLHLVTLLTVAAWLFGAPALLSAEDQVATDCPVVPEAGPEDSGMCGAPAALSTKGQPSGDDLKVEEEPDPTGVPGAPAPLSAEDQPSGDDPEMGEQPDDIEMLAATRQALYGSTYWLVKNVDSWFGDMPFEEGGRVSGSVRLRVLYRQDDGFDNDSRFRIRVRMPNVSEFGYVFLGRDNEQEVIRDEDEAFRVDRSAQTDSRTEDQAFFVGVGRMLRENLDLRLGVRSGYKPYAQARYGKTLWLSYFSNIAYRQTVFLAVEDGFGTNVGLNYAHELNSHTAVRWRNSATIGTETNGVEWSTSLGLFRSLGRDRAISFEFLADGDTDGSVLVEEYGLRSIYATPIYRDWIIGELIGGYFWPREDDEAARDQTVSLGLGVELRF
jgi:hypothetical protein